MRLFFRKKNGADPVPGGNKSIVKEESLMASVEQTLQQVERQLGLYKEAVGQRDGLLRAAYGEIAGLKEELAKWKAAVEERDGLLSTAHGEIKEKDEVIQTLTQQVSEAGKRIANIGDPAAPPTRNA